MIVTPASNVTPQPLPWLSSFDVGDRRIDGEHRALIELANDLCAMAVLAPPPHLLRGAAHELIAVVEAHFESEEALFPLIHYPAQQVHVREHLALLAELNALLLADDLPDPSVAAATARLVLIEHILRHDLGIKTWVEAWQGQ
ncbi:MAG: bacteriohemerythrin [Bacteroidota bacterium]